jgi:hypothetical protein
MGIITQPEGAVPAEESLFVDEDGPGMVVEIEIEFDAVGGTDQAELHSVSAIAAMWKGLSGQQRSLVCEAMLIVPEAIHAGMDHEVAGQKIPGFSFGKTLRTNRGGSHNLQLYRETMVSRIARGSFCHKMMLAMTISDSYA